MHWSNGAFPPVQQAAMAVAPLQQFAPAPMASWVPMQSPPANDQQQENTIAKAQYHVASTENKLAGSPENQVGTETELIQDRDPIVKHTLHQIAQAQNKLAGPGSEAPPPPVPVVPVTPVPVVPVTPVTQVPVTPVTQVPVTPVAQVPVTPVTQVPVTPVVTQSAVEGPVLQPEDSSSASDDTAFIQTDPTVAQTQYHIASAQNKLAGPGQPPTATAQFSTASPVYPPSMTVQSFAPFQTPLVQAQPMMQAPMMQAQPQPFMQAPVMQAPMMQAQPVMQAPMMQAQPVQPVADPPMHWSNGAFPPVQQAAMAFAPLQQFAPAPMASWVPMQSPPANDQQQENTIAKAQYHVASTENKLAGSPAEN